MSEKLNATGYIARIVSMRSANNRKGLAEIRRAQSVTQQSSAYEHVMPYIPTTADAVLVRIMCVVGAHAVKASKVIVFDRKKYTDNFGDTLRKLKGDRRNSESVTIADRYIKQLMGCDREDLPERINHIMSVVGSHGIVVDYVSLINDMHFWNEKTMLSWARHFYHNVSEAT